MESKTYLIPLNMDYEQRIFNNMNLDYDCYTIGKLMYNERQNIGSLAAKGKYREAALLFLQLTRSMCIHFIEDRHWEYFDDMYSPEYEIENLKKMFGEYAVSGKLPVTVNEYIHKAWKEIAETESCREYGIPRDELPF